MTYFIVPVTTYDNNKNLFHNLFDYVILKKRLNDKTIKNSVCLSSHEKDILIQVFNRILYPWSQILGLRKILQNTFIT